MDVEALAQLLHETEEHHGAFVAVAPPHNWWDRYVAYMNAREGGATAEEAAAAAGRYMAEVKHVVVTPGLTSPWGAGDPARVSQHRQPRQSLDAMPSLKRSP
jgi:hypothetical protein